MCASCLTPFHLSVLPLRYSWSSDAFKMSHVSPSLTWFLFLTLCSLVPLSGCGRWRWIEPQLGCGDPGELQAFDKGNTIRAYSSWQSTERAAHRFLVLPLIPYSALHCGTGSPLLSIFLQPTKQLLYFVFVIEQGQFANAILLLLLLLGKTERPSETQYMAYSPRAVNRKQNHWWREWWMRDSFWKV